MAVPETSVLDNFNDTESPMTGWTNVSGGLRSTGSYCYGTTADQVNVAFYNTEFGNDQEAFCTTKDGLAALWVYCNLDVENTNMYEAYFGTAIGDYDSTLARYDGGVTTELDTWTKALVSGDTGFVQKIGTTIKAYEKHGETVTEKGSAAVGTNYTGGVLALAVWGNALPVEDFGGGTIVVASGVPLSNPFSRPFRQAFGRGGF